VLLLAASTAGQLLQVFATSLATSQRKECAHLYAAPGHVLACMLSKFESGLTLMLLQLWGSSPTCHAHGACAHQFVSYNMMLMLGLIMSVQLLHLTHRQMDVKLVTATNSCTRKTADSQLNR
jgi:hypothetical protein